MTKSRIHMLGGRNLFRPLLFLLVFALWFEGCTLPKEPGSLWWDIDLVVPLGVRTYGIWDMADPDSVLRAEGSGIGLEDDSSAFFSMWTDVTASVAGSLYFLPLEFDVFKPVEAVQVPVNCDDVLRYSLGMLNSDLAEVHGSVIDLEPFEFSSLIEIPLNSLIDSMTIDAGTAHLLLINGLPVAAQFYVALYDDIHQTQHLTSLITLESSAQVAVDASLAELSTLENTDIAIIGMALGGSQILIDTTDQITVGLQIDTITAAPYYGRIPEQFLYGDSSITSGQPHILELATIRSGSLSVRLTNSTQVDDTLTMVLPDLINQLNDSLVISRFVTAGSSDSDMIDLAGARLRPPVSDPQFLTGRIFVHSQTTDDVRAFESPEFASGNVSISRLEFDYFDGELRNLQVPLHPTGIPIERPPDGWETIHPTQVDGIIHIEESFGGIADLDLTVESFLFGTPLESENIRIEEIDLVEDTVTTVTGLEALLRDYPDSAAVTGMLNLNGDVALYNDSEILLGVEIKAPLAIVLDRVNPPGTIEKIDTGDLRDIQSGGAEINIRNRLPVGGRVFLIVARDSLDLLVDSGADADTLLDVALPVPEIVDGRAVGIALYETSLSLTDSVISFFQNPPFYARLEVDIPGSNGDTLYVHGSDYLNVRILARLVYQIRTGDIE